MCASKHNWRLKSFARPVMSMLPLLLSSAMVTQPRQHLRRAEIRGIELADVRQQCGSKKAAVTNRWVISKARVINGDDFIRKMDERQEVDRLKEEKELRKLALSKLRAPSRGKKPKVCSKYLLLILVI